MQDTCPNTTPRAASRLTLGTLILAATSALGLVTMSGCHSAPATSAFAGTAADKATEARLRRADTMAPLQPFDEGFVPAAVD